MSKIMFDTKSKEIDVALVRAKGAQVKVASNATTAEATASNVGVSENMATDTIIDEEAHADEMAEQEASDAQATVEIVSEDMVGENTEDAIPDEAAIDDVAIDGMVEGEIILDDPMPIMDGGMEGDYVFDEGMYMDPTMETMAEVKDPLLSSWPFVIGISAAVLAVSVFLGVLLARLKIKKGIELYED